MELCEEDDAGGQVDKSSQKRGRSIQVENWLSHLIGNEWKSHSNSGIISIPASIVYHDFIFIILSEEEWVRESRKMMREKERVSVVVVVVVPAAPKEFLEPSYPVDLKGIIARQNTYMFLFSILSEDSGGALTL